MVSASRQQMVGHLLKDIVESSEKPSLVCQQDPKYDRFGFKIDEEGSLEEKAERLRRVAQDNWEESELSLEEVQRVKCQMSNVKYQITNNKYIKLQINQRENVQWKNKIKHVSKSFYPPGGISLERCCCQPEEASPVHSDSGHQATDQSWHPHQSERPGLEGNS